MVIEVNTGESASGYMELETTGDKRGEGFPCGKCVSPELPSQMGPEGDPQSFDRKKAPPFLGSSVSLQ